MNGAQRYQAMSGTPSLRTRKPRIAGNICTGTQAIQPYNYIPSMTDIGHDHEGSHPKVSNSGFSWVVRSADCCLFGSISHIVPTRCSGVSQHSTFVKGKVTGSTWTGTEQKDSSPYLALFFRIAVLSRVQYRSFTIRLSKARSPRNIAANLPHAAASRHNGWNVTTVSQSARSRQIR
jgi:hypothetical protein